MNDISFKLSGLTCESCAKLAAAKIRKMPGVNDVIIDLKTGDAYVSSEADLDLSIIAQSLDGTPYSIAS